MATPFSYPLHSLNVGPQDTYGQELQQSTMLPFSYTLRLGKIACSEYLKYLGQWGKLISRLSKKIFLCLAEITIFQTQETQYLLFSQ